MTRGRGGTVRRDLDGREPGTGDCLGEEPPRGSGVPARREVHVDDLAELVDGPEQVASGPPDLQVGLIDMPAMADDVPAASGGLGELRGEPMDPPVHRDVVHFDAAFGEELLDVPIGQTEP
jgi:hypothetical protein